nr:hypothetical protein DM860_016817 [Ipomoea trifida]
MAGVETLHSEPRLPLIASPATGNLFRQLVGGSFFSFRDVYVVYLAVLSDWVPYGSMNGRAICAAMVWFAVVAHLHSSRGTVVWVSISQLILQSPKGWCHFHFCTGGKLCYEGPSRLCNASAGSCSMDALFTQTECTITYSSNNTKFWAPNCDDSVGPYLGQMFGTVEQGEVFYFEYARAVGFDVRRSMVKKDRSGNTTVRHLALSVEDNSAPVRRGKHSVIENFCGSGVAEPVVIRPPVVARNKGRRKSLKGAREIAVASKKKGERTCATCGLANGHDSRNCELREKNPDSEGWF